MLLVLSSSLAVCPCRAATLAWVNDLVIGQRLCPWASDAIRSPAFRLLTVDDVEDFETATAAAANELKKLEEHRATTLLVLDSRAAQLDVQSFGRICSAAARRCGDGIDLLGFHPARVDVGPGCSTRSEDAAHFSVRSPLPTIQLLRTDDLVEARAEWRERHGSALPGAFELLQDNKKRLRSLGRVSLQRMMDAWLARLKR